MSEDAPTAPRPDPETFPDIDAPGGGGDAGGGDGAGDAAAGGTGTSGGAAESGAGESGDGASGVSDAPRAPEWLDLAPGEQLIAHEHPHITHYAGDVAVGVGLAATGTALLLAAVGVAAGAVAGVAGPVGRVLSVAGVAAWEAGAAATLLGAFMVVEALVRRRITHYVVTDQQVFKEVRLFVNLHNHVAYSDIQKMDRIHTKWQFVASLLFGTDVGTIAVGTAGTDTYELTLANIPDYEAVWEGIRTVRQRYEVSETDDDL